MKKWIALLLSFVLMLSALPLGVFAETERKNTEAAYDSVRYRRLESRDRG